jgi:molybdate transport system substrate-binding protein
MTRLSSRALAALTMAGLLLTTAACGSGPGTDDESPQGGGSSSTSSGAGSDLSGSITVFAAASLKATFTEIGAEFEKAHPGTKVAFNFAGSSDLVAQIQQGAPADVFASADTANMDKLSAPDDLIGDGPENFASNTLEIAVPPDNPAGITSLQDLTEDGVNLVVCAPEVPCGSATQKVAEAAGLTFTPVSEEQSVTDVLNKVTTGEADAGLVYVTDVKGAGDAVQGITFPESADAVNVYPIATVADSKHADLAREFMDLVLGEAGQAVLAEAGFAGP